MPLGADIQAEGGKHTQSRLAMKKCSRSVIRRGTEIREDLRMLKVL